MQQIQAYDRGIKEKQIKNRTYEQNDQHNRMPTAFKNHGVEGFIQKHRV